jgi:hypothetical protein
MTMQTRLGCDGTSCRCKFVHHKPTPDFAERYDKMAIVSPQLTELAKLLDPERKPVLVVGSGLLRQCNFGPFADWTTLLHEVAHRLRVPFNETLAREHPTLYWESMLVEVAARTKRAPSKHEPRGLRFVRDAIKSAAQGVSCAKMQSLTNSDNLQSIVSLNFTACPFAESEQGTVRDDGLVSLDSSGRVIWFPHGHWKHSRSLRMSARSYARFAQQLETWRCRYHKQRGGESCLRRLPATSRSVHFMADLLESPLIFAGCGIRHSEWTIWWLLATKARNEARHATARSLFLTADCMPAEKAAALEGLNCSIARFPSYNDLWNSLLAYCAGTWTNS